MSRKANLSREQLEQFAIEYLDVTKSCKDLAEKYNLSYKNLPWHMKRAVGLGLLGESGGNLYNDAKNKRKLLSLHGRYFSDERKKDIIEGKITYETIRIERTKTAQTIEERVRNTSDEQKTLESNSDIGKDYGNRMYGKPKSKPCVSKIIKDYEKISAEKENTREVTNLMSYRQKFLQYLNSLRIKFQTNLEKSILGRIGAMKTNDIKKNGNSHNNL
jgi:hypothetical protein